MSQMLEQIKERAQELVEETRKWLKQPKNKFLILGLLLAFFYAAGLLAQFMNNRFGWTPGRELRLPSLNPLKCLAMLFTPYGAKAIATLFSFLLIAMLFYWMNREDRIEYIRRVDIHIALGKIAVGDKVIMGEHDSLRCSCSS